MRSRARTRWRNCFAIGRGRFGNEMEPKSIAYNVDCLAYMKSLPDKAFDLAVVDPPYGGGGGKASQARSDLVGTSTSIGPISRTGGKWASKYGKK